MKTNQKLGSLQGRFTYAIRCDKKKPIKNNLTCCNPLFVDELLTFGKKDRPLMIFAMGDAVLRALGVQFRKYTSLQERFVSCKIKGRRVYIFVSMSKQQLAAKTGYFELFKIHVNLFLAAVRDLQKGKTPQLKPSRDELSKNYQYPKTIAQVSKLVDHIIGYSERGKDPDNWAISIDTETNTKFAHRPKLRLLSVVVSWGKGLAASIPVDHPESPWTFEEVAPHIQRLLLCSKPKVLHNAKFDYKVLKRQGWEMKRLAWDTMTGEHNLVEDKKGFYGLKDLTNTMVPTYAGYEGQLQDIMAQEEADSQIAESKKEKTKKPKLKGAAKKLADDTETEGFLKVPLAELNLYGAVDADVTRQIMLLQRERGTTENWKLAKKRRRLGRNIHFRKIARPGTDLRDPLTHNMFHRIIPATKVLANMELYGVKVDRDYLDELAVRMNLSIQHSEAEMIPMTPEGIEFNPSSAHDLRKLLFGTGFKHPETGEVVCYQGVVEPPRTETGLPSTNAQFLRLLKTQYDCPLSDAVLRYRATHKALTTFVSNIRALSEEDGRMHTNFHQHGTATYRLSSSDENMQNIPFQIGDHNIKKIFIPTNRETDVICNADAKAAEVRMYAAYSKDPNLIKALNEGMDPHSFFAGMVFNPDVILEGVPSDMKKIVLDTVGIDDEHNWDYDDFVKRGYLIGSKKSPGPDPAYGKRLEKLRKNIKRLVFGILYGASKFKISSIVGIPNEQAQAIIDSLFKMFPSIPAYIAETKDQVRHIGAVETFLGRRRRFDLRGLTPYMKSKAERQAVNFKIQSTSSDVVLEVLCDVEDPIRRDFGGHLLITVHDSIVAEIPKKYVSQLPDFFEKYGVENVARRCPWLPVPFKWDVEVGPSYGEVIDVNDYINENNIAYFDPEDYLEQEIKADFEKEMAVS
jgi:DNA polymerase I-like protein with 3'-5' exonuclease and polymerase domains